MARVVAGFCNHLGMKALRRSFDAGQACLFCCLLAGTVGFATFHLAQPTADGPFYYGETTWQQEAKDVFPHEFFREFDPSGRLPAATLVNDLGALQKEALVYVDLLMAQDDHFLTEEEKASKYRSLALAAMLVSATLDDRTEQRYWSGLAIGHCQTALQVLDNPDHAPAEILDEIKARQLVALAMNHYQGGRVQRGELAGIFASINQNFLVRKGFCRYKIMMALDRDGIIRLPAFSEKKYI